MAKYLLLILVVMIVFGGLMARRRPPRRQAAPPPAAGGTPQALESMVACARCGVHLPQREAVGTADSAASGELFYCSPEHRRLGPGRPAGS